MIPLTIYDNSMVQEFLSCPRKFFLRYALHLVSKDHSKDFQFEFGTALHSGLETYYTGGTLEQVKVAFTVHWLPFEGMDPKGIRTLLKGITILEEYVKLHPIDLETWEVVYATGAELEIAVDISCPESGEILFIGKVDLAVRDKRTKMLAPLDHKSTGWSGFLTTKPNHQIAGYGFSLGEMTGEEVDGGYINQIYFTKLQCKFTREKASFSLSYLKEEWLKDIQTVIGWIKECFKRDFFPKNTGNCSQYGGCPFLLLCKSSQNDPIYPSLISTLYEEEVWEPYPGARSESTHTTTGATK